MAEEKKKPIEAYGLIRHNQNIERYADEEAKKHRRKVYEEGVRSVIKDIVEPRELRSLIMELHGRSEYEPYSSARRLLPIVRQYQSELSEPIARDFYATLVGQHGFEKADPKALEDLFGIKPDGVIKDGVYVACSRMLSGLDVWALLPLDATDYSPSFSLQRHVLGKRFLATTAWDLGSDNQDERVQKVLGWVEDGVKVLAEHK